MFTCRLDTNAFFEVFGFESFASVKLYFPFQLVEDGEEKIIHLTESELRKVVGDQIVSLLKLWKVQCYPLDQLMTDYMQHYKYYVPLHDLRVHTPQQLMAKLKHVLKVSAMKCMSKKCIRINEWNWLRT